MNYLTLKKLRRATKGGEFKVEDLHEIEVILDENDQNDAKTVNFWGNWGET